MFKRGFLDDIINKLLLVRLGQELGTNSELARYVAGFVDVFLSSINKVLLIGIFFHVGAAYQNHFSFHFLVGYSYTWRF